MAVPLLIRTMAAGPYPPAIYSCTGEKHVYYNKKLSFQAGGLSAAVHFVHLAAHPAYCQDPSWQLWCSALVSS